MTNVPPCSAVFQRAICPHPQLFEDEYKRCFPHCCPCHVDRGYCGSPVEVSVCFHPMDGIPFDESKVFIFARFETADEHKLPVEISTLQGLRSIPQNDPSVESPWIEGIRDQRQDSLTFMLNGEPYDKWYYHWESGSHKTQRSTKHVLRAYVLYQYQAMSTDQNEQSTDGPLDLLCIATSPPFTLASYRRSSLNISVTSASSPDSLKMSANHKAVPDLQDEADSSLSLGSSLYQVLKHIPEAFQEHTSKELRTRPFEADNNTVETHLLYGPSPMQKDHIDRYREFVAREGLQSWLLTPEHAALSDPLLHSQIQSREQRLVFHRTRYRDENQQIDANIDYQANNVRFESTNLFRNPMDESKCVILPAVLKPTGPHTVNILKEPFHQQQMDRRGVQLQQLTDLAIIHCFVSIVPISWIKEAANLELMTAKAIVKYWYYEPAEALHLSRLLLIVSTNEISDTSSVVTGALSHKAEEILRVLVEICIWTFAPENFELIKNLLTTCFPLLDGLPNRSSTNANIKRSLRENFLECVGRCWSKLDEFLQITFAKSSMICSVRGLSDTVLRVVYSDPMFEELRSELRGVLERLEVHFDDTDIYGSNSLFSNILGWRGFIAQVREGYSVQAEPSLLPHDNKWLRLICDGRVRVAPVAPNGMVSLLTGSPCVFGGDYMAHFLQQTPKEDDGCVDVRDASFISLEFYWWPLQQTNLEKETSLVAYRVVVTLRTTHQSNFCEARARFDRGVVNYDAIMAAPTPHLEMWTPSQRAGLAINWQLWLQVDGHYIIQP
ncbi:hypothetical protein PHMEG_00018804 [Phytophthora megakarya]|uniref:Uncharacterized protein n=1 Tax=Phytophthora megakarya TaxID=4795 RepID=A0A225VVQ5_9STRA|nr:hypothetical protein PHMEG_00018804 [Phytophthora megakarya]